MAAYHIENNEDYPTLSLIKPNEGAITQSQFTMTLTPTAFLKQIGVATFVHNASSNEHVFIQLSTLCNAGMHFDVSLIASIPNAKDTAPTITISEYALKYNAPINVTCFYKFRSVFQYRCNELHLGSNEHHLATLREKLTTNKSTFENTLAELARIYNGTSDYAQLIETNTNHFQCEEFQLRETIAMYEQRVAFAKLLNSAHQE